MVAPLWTRAATEMSLDALAEMAFMLGGMRTFAHLHHSLTVCTAPLPLSGLGLSAVAFVSDEDARGHSAICTSGRAFSAATSPACFVQALLVSTLSRTSAALRPRGSSRKPWLTPREDREVPPANNNDTNNNKTHNTQTKDNDNSNSNSSTCKSKTPDNATTTNNNIFVAGACALVRAEGRDPRLRAHLGWHYLSNATCLIRPHWFYVYFVVSWTVIICYIIRHF